MTPTQEELAVMIQTGDESKVPVLWETVRKLYTLKAYRYYSSHRAACDRAGVELDDLQQQCFFAFLDAVKAYDPGAELPFTAYINYHFRTAMQELTQTRTERQMHDALQECISLDTIIEPTGSDGDGLTLEELVADPAALDFVELLDAQSVGAMIRAEVRQLPDRESTVISDYFFNGLSLVTIGKKLKLTTERVRQIKNRALKALSRRRRLVDLWNEYHHTSRLRALERQKNEPGAAQDYTRQTEPELTVIDLACQYAQRKRAKMGISPADWTRDDQIQAVLEYLHSIPAKPKPN